MSATETMTTGSGTTDLLQKLPAQHVQPLWTAMQVMVTQRPSPKAEVALWKYDALRPLLLEAGRTVSSEEAERRVLMLINPALSKPDTFRD
jgi:gentisate 1,2-dioxygenase